MRDEGTVFLGRTYVWIRQIAIKCTASGANSVVQLQGRIYRCANSIAIDSQKARLESDVGGKRHTSITWGLGIDDRWWSTNLQPHVSLWSTDGKHENNTLHTEYWLPQYQYSGLYSVREEIYSTSNARWQSKLQDVTYKYLYDSLVALRVLHGNCWYAF